MALHRTKKNNYNMRAKEGFKLREVCGENILVAEGKENIDFSDIISMNESAAYLWNNLQGREFSVETMAELLIKEYEIDDATALADARETAGMWGKVQIIEGDDIPEYDKKIREAHEELKSAGQDDASADPKNAKKGLFGKIKDLF